MKTKLLFILLLIALLPGALFAAKPVTQPNHALWVDANEVMIGDAQTDVRPEITNVYFEVNENLYLAHIDQGKLTGGNTPVLLLYDQPECTGNAYLLQREIIGGVDILHGLREGIFYVADGDEQIVILASVWDETEKPAVCGYYGYANNVLPAVPIIDTNVYAKPYQLKLIPAK